MVSYKILCRDELGIWCAGGIPVRPPCEVIAFQVLPSLRSELVRILIRDHGMAQRDIADRLGLSKAAVSQYVSEKRGREMDFPEDVRRDLDVLAARIASGASGDESCKMLCSTCKNIQGSGFLCELHASAIN